MSIYFYVSLSLCTSCLWPLSLPNLTLSIPACWPDFHPSPLSLSLSLSFTPTLSHFRKEIPCCWVSFLVEQTLLLYRLVVPPSFARDFWIFIVSCLYVSLSLCFYVSVSSPLSISLPNLTLNMPACWPARPPLSLSLSPPPSLFPDKKFPAVEAHFWLDELFYYID